MQVQSVVFHRAAYRREDFIRDGRPQLAFVGRSNVGKSTLINTILRRKNIARVSQTPGKTQAVHYILINDRIHFVDLPGYGYAKVSKSTRAEWGRLMTSYFEHPEAVRAFFILLDARRKPSGEDQMMFDLAAQVGIPTEVVLTKADKISKGQLAQAKKAVATELALEPESVIPFSGTKRIGVEQIWRRIDAALANENRKAKN